MKCRSGTRPRFVSSFMRFFSIALILLSVFLSLFWVLQGIVWQTLLHNKLSSLSQKILDRKKQCNRSRGMKWILSCYFPLSLLCHLRQQIILIAKIDFSFSSRSFFCYFLAQELADDVEDVAWLRRVFLLVMDNRVRTTGHC